LRWKKVYASRFVKVAEQSVQVLLLRLLSNFLKNNNTLK
jgi:hypothetical protein